MKKQFILIIAAALTSMSAVAQIPNSGFENWTSMGSYSNPDNWDQLNAMTTMASVYTCNKGTPGNVGTAYLKLTSKTVGTMGVIPGIATNGTINATTMQVLGGSPNTTRPAAFTGKWQYMGYSGDVGFVSVYLTKWNTATMMRDTIAKGSQNLTGMVMSWASFNINLTYASQNFPDTVQIILSSSGTTPANNSYLYVDNLAFSGSVPGNAVGINSIANYLSTISIYPNPSKDQIAVELNVQQTATVKMELTDITGRLIKEIAMGEITGSHKAILNVDGIAQGSYLLKITTNNAVEIKKVIIN